MKIVKPIVLHVAIDSPNYSSTGINKAFENNGYEVIMFKWQDYRFSNGIEETRKEIIRLAKERIPDLIFFHVQNESILDIDTVSILTGMSITVNYTFDVRTKEKTEWLYKLAPFFSLTLFACKEDADECKGRGIRNVNYIHSSCDIDIYKSLQLPEDIKSKYPSEIAFIGNNFEDTNLEFEGATQRRQMVQFLEKEFKDNFEVFGMNWNPSRLINPQEEINIYNSCKIAIAQNNFKRTGYTSDRIFRIMASGCFCLTEYYVGIEKDFKKGVHLEWWKTFDELRALIILCLSDNEERNLIAKIGSTFVRENMNWSNSIAEIKTMINE